jgi:hypothetical protein
LDKEAEPKAAQERIAQWLWCGVLGELYGGAAETRFARDLPEVVAWVRGGEHHPRTIIEAVFSETRLWTLRTRNSAAYKGLYTLLLRGGASDWRTGDPIGVTTYFDEAIDIHHVFPKHWCQGRHLPVKEYDSIVNKTPLSARTNRKIGGRAPSEYRERVAKDAGIPLGKLDPIVETHLIPVAQLWADDFDGFLEARAQLLLHLVEGAMGKPPLRDQGMSGQEPSVQEESDVWEEVEDE